MDDEGDKLLIITERQHMALCSFTLAIQSNTTVTGSQAIQQAPRRPAFIHGPLKQTHTNRNHMQTHGYTDMISEYGVWGLQFTLIRQTMHTETCTAAFLCVHIHSDINTHETGDAADSINKKGNTHAHTSKALKRSPYLFCLQRS